MRKPIKEHVIFPRKEIIEKNFENSLVTIENQTGMYKLTNINNKVFTFTKQSTMDTLHFIVENGKHRKIKLI